MGSLIRRKAHQQRNTGSVALQIAAQANPFRLASQVRSPGTIEPPPEPTKSETQPCPSTGNTVKSSPRYPQHPLPPRQIRKPRSAVVAAATKYPCSTESSATTLSAQLATETHRSSSAVASSCRAYPEGRKEVLSGVRRV